MLYSELLRVTVLLIAAVGTALVIVAVAIAQQDDDTTALLVGVAWWIVATAIGLIMGRASATADAMSRTLAEARTATSLPPDSPARIAFMRLWPIGAFALACWAAGFFWPQVAAIGAGYAILIALAWRRRDGAVRAIEDRDGVRFYVEPSSAFEPLRLLRTPGLYRDRSPVPKPPPPPPPPAE
jgi:hypothetical protein